MLDQIFYRHDFMHKAESTSFVGIETFCSQKISTSGPCAEAHVGRARRACLSAVVVPRFRPCYTRLRVNLDPSRHGHARSPHEEQYIVW